MTMAASHEKAKELVIAYFQTLELNGYRYEHVSTRINAILRNEWNVVFDVYSPNGCLIDGPAVFVVEKGTGLVRSIMAL